MLWLKRIIFTLPVVVLLFFAAAFLFVRYASAPPENALVMGSIGEPENVNPIRATTTSASEVTGLVFSGLIRTDEDLDLVGELATDWRIDQDSQVFFDTQSDAEDFLTAARAAAEQIHLTDASRAGTVVKLHFAGVGGNDYFVTLADAVARTRPRPVWIFTLSPGRGAFDDGAKVTVESLRERAVAALGGLPAATTAPDAAASQADAPESTDTQAESAATLAVASTQPDAVKVIRTYQPLGALLEIVGHGDQAEARRRLEALLKIGDDPEKEGQALGELAVESLAALDQPTYTFKLRKGVKWQVGTVDGTRYPARGEPAVEFTADDVVFTCESLVDPKVLSPRAADYIMVESVEAVDRYTVAIKYKKPYSSALVSWTMSILPKHILSDIPVARWADTFDRHPIGTGPFKFDNWVTGERLRLVRNDDYWEGPPNLDAIYIRYIPDPVNIKLALETGEIDFYSVEPNEIGRFERNPEFELFEFLSRGYNYVGWNLNNPLFQDVRVRKALAHAIDVDKFIEKFQMGRAVRSNGIYTPQFWFANPDIAPLKYDPDLARRLLAEAGWTDTDGDGYLDKDGKRFEFNLITNNGNETRRSIQVIAQANLEAVGIKVNIPTYEWAVFIQKYINPQNFDACVLGWSVGIDYDMYQLWHSSQTHPGELNFCNYKNPRADQLIEQIRVTYDHEQVKKRTHELQRVIYDDQPYLWLYVPKATVALKSNTYRVHRPDGKGGWIEEPIRQTKAGFTIYLPYWYRTASPPPGVAGKAGPADGGER